MLRFGCCPIVPERCLQFSFFLVGSAMSLSWVPHGREYLVFPPGGHRYEVVGNNQSHGLAWLSSTASRIRHWTMERYGVR